MSIPGSARKNNAKRGKNLASTAVRWRRKKPRRDPDVIRYMAINAPRWSPKKRFVISAVVQAHRMRKMLNRRGVDVAGILESYAAQRAALRSPRWGVWAPQSNPGGPGQGLVRRRSPRRLRITLRAKRTVATPFKKYARTGGLKMGAVDVHRGRTTIPTAVMHLPTVGDDSADQWRDQAETVAASLPARGPAIVLADVNRDPEKVCDAMGPGWKVVARSDVIVILARDCRVIADGVERDMYARKIGDHSGAPWADLKPASRHHAK